MRSGYHLPPPPPSTPTSSAAPHHHPPRAQTRTNYFLLSSLASRQLQRLLHQSYRFFDRALAWALIPRLESDTDTGVWQLDLVVHSSIIDQRHPSENTFLFLHHPVHPSWKGPGGSVSDNICLANAWMGSIGVTGVSVVHTRYLTLRLTIVHIITGIVCQWQPVQ